MIWHKGCDHHMRWYSRCICVEVNRKSVVKTRFPHLNVTGCDTSSLQLETVLCDWTGTEYFYRPSERQI